jgi:hypothetical protein
LTESVMSDPLLYPEVSIIKVLGDDGSIYLLLLERSFIPHLLVLIAYSC